MAFSADSDASSALTRPSLNSYKFDVTEIDSMTSRTRFERAHTIEQRQDVRESGESPLLPRNCERSPSGYRRFDSRMEQKDQPQSH
jgi:hypothetical protein